MEYQPPVSLRQLDRSVWLSQQVPQHSHSYRSTCETRGTSRGPPVPAQITPLLPAVRFFLYISLFEGQLLAPSDNMATQDLTRLGARSDSYKPTTLQSLLKNTITDVISQGMRIPQDFSLLLSIGETEIDSGLIDDEKQLVGFLYGQRVALKRAE